MTLPVNGWYWMLHRLRPGLWLAYTWVLSEGDKRDSKSNMPASRRSEDDPNTQHPTTTVVHGYALSTTQQKLLCSGASVSD